MTRLRKRILFAISGILVVSCIVSVVVISARRQSQKPTKKEWLTSVPQVDSKVKNLQIINPRIIRQDTETPGVAFEVWNNSGRAVMAIEISCGRPSIAKDGLEDDENPTVIIEPYGTLPVEMYDELEEGHPIVITAAVFNDNKEEGQKSSLDLMKKIRERQRAKIKLRKAQAAGSPN